MRVRSVELRTTLMINAMYGLVEERDAPGVGAYLAARTPAVPDYWYGNCLAMPRLPAAGELPLWESLFEREHPGAEHRVFLIDAPEGTGGASDGEPVAEGRHASTQAGLAGFVAAGYELSSHDVLATDAIRRPALLNEEFDYRPVRTDEEWEAVLEASLAINAGQPGYTRGFLERKFKAIRSAVEGGHGAWWAAWEPRSGGRVGELAGGRHAGGRRAGERPVANLGLFWSGGLARFQDVETDPDFRRRGICRSLVYSACASITASGGGAGRSSGAPPFPTLFVIKPEDDAVRRIYEAVGFSFLERSVDLFKLVGRV